MRQEKAFRGISQRLAAQYLRNLGGEGESDDRIEGDDWTAELDSEVVNVAGSMELSEVTIVFEGPEERLEPLIEDFSRKAMRAGG
ncbi:hypothetical protein [Halosegnis sp.]|uniref:hypothetical protein n=1 Tax=Halosegnis sp. TaxID=2864959 RepID=UPI0035D4B06E